MIRGENEVSPIDGQQGISSFFSPMKNTFLTPNRKAGEEGSEAYGLPSINDVATER